MQNSKRLVCIRYLWAIVDRSILCSDEQCEVAQGYPAKCLSINSTYKCPKTSKSLEKMSVCL